MFDDERQVRDFVKRQNHDDSFYEIKRVENIHQEQSFLSWDNCLEALVFDYGADEDRVYELTSICGEEEDFDRLITLPDDYITTFESVWWIKSSKIVKEFCGKFV